LTDAASSSGRLATVSAAILLGGASRRMGRDKARLSIDGVAAVTRLARACEELFDDVLLVGGDPPVGTPGRRIPDPPGPPSPLRGFVGALEAARAERVLVLATDLLLVTPDLLLALVAWPEAAAVVPRPVEGPQPLCAMYARDAVLPIAKQRLGSGDLSLRGLLDAIETVSFLEPADLREIDAEASALANVNTPEDFERVLGVLRSRAP
jgi:molybdopterin-guanine dinucleotide biosynthesis protein A